MGLGICCCNHPRCCLDLKSQMVLQGVDYSRRNLVLHREDIRKFPIVGLGPKMKTVAGIDKLGRDPYLSACLADAALQNQSHI